MLSLVMTTTATCMHILSLVFREKEIASFQPEGMFSCVHLLKYLKNSKGHGCQPLPDRNKMFKCFNFSLIFLVVEVCSSSKNTSRGVHVI